ncbi:MAG TPA: leucyl aminopeptidase [Kineosporiaceae bacterium]|nr:leucyl aminopeptidase [Kineosporiaceae bacterium]
MAAVTLSAESPADVAADVLVLAVAADGSPGGEPVLLGTDRLPGRLRAALGGPLLRSLGVSGRGDEVRRVPSAGTVTAPVIALTGLGEAGPDAETLRRAAGAAVRELAGTATVALALPVRTAADVAAVAEGGVLGAYAFGGYRVKAAAGDRPPVENLVVVVPPDLAPEADGVLGRVDVVGEAVATTRDLVNTPPCDLYPATFATAARDAVADLPVEVTVLEEGALAEGGFGGLLGVGTGSARPPRLVRLDYAPESAPAHVALVGKGITFDSGGLSIKPASAMQEMKSDMAGAAAVLAVLVAAARLELPVRVSGWLALAENMPSGTAQRPSDALRIRGGRTVEVLNTDAEGRLVLADAIVAASETGPDLIVDVATLTGAQVVALGKRVSAVMGNDDALRDRLVRMAGEAGELLWPMPLPPELRAGLDSPVADIANIGDRSGGMLVAGLFLAEFVGMRRSAGEVPGAGTSPPAVLEPADEGRIPWAHLDIAGPSFNGGSPHGYTPTGGTGVMVRTLLRLLEDVAAQGA